LPASQVLIFKKITELNHYVSLQKRTGKTVGFVPTMGALHEGHISLIQASKLQTNITICSIFVNPTQFNDQNDLQKYPRTPESDIEMLKSAGCDGVFMPEVSEMYPTTDERQFDFGHLDKILEGAHRPSHFNGVAQIVSKLFEYVNADKAFFGSKDYQQVMVVRELVKQLNYPLEIIACPIIRENDGLAMSSRNMLLNPEERKAASFLPFLMNKVMELKQNGFQSSQIKEFVSASLVTNPIYKLDYFVLCDPETLQEVELQQDLKVIALIACFVGKIRLLDNHLI
jgi:pantoate--beta-alanine ligase